MAKAAKRAISTALFIAALCVAISQTSHEGWLTVWFLLLFFTGIPLALLSVRDLLASVAPNWLKKGPLLLHTCAIFAAGVGYAVAWMAVDSEHPQADLHQWLIIAFPAFVYVSPLFMMLHGLSWPDVKRFYGGDDSDKDT